MDTLYIEYNSLANQSDGSCQIIARYGCMDLTALNYDASANTNQVSFLTLFQIHRIPYIWGCMDDGTRLFDLDGDVYQLLIMILLLTLMMEVVLRWYLDV